jgi:uncharacterized protein (DUF58 family)
VLTRRGALLLSLGVLLLIGGRVFGLPNLYVLAAAALISVAAAVAYVRFTPFPLIVRRRISPRRVQLDATCRVDLEVRNEGRRRVPSLLAEEPFGAEGVAASFLVPALAPGEAARAAYRVPTDRRGRYELGPLRLRLEDPFSLAHVERAGTGGGAVLVYPRIEALPGIPPAAGHDPHSGALARTARSQGEDFFALRPYEVGDDLRRVHWPSTARTDELMIRQVELPWQHRVSVLLDARRGVHDSSSFELAVSAAASILSGSADAGALVRLVTTAGLDSDFGSGPDHLEAGLAALAAVGPSGPGGLRHFLSASRAMGSGSALAVVTTSSLGAADAASVGRLRDRAGLVVVVMVERDGTAGSSLASLSGRGGSGLVRVVSVSPAHPLADAWQEDPVLALGPRRARRRRVARVEA